MFVTAFKSFFLFFSFAEPNKKLIGPRFKGDQKKVMAAIEALEGEELEAFKAELEKVSNDFVYKSLFS